MFTEERAGWLYQHYRWLDAELPRRSERPRLIAPTPEFYPMRNTRDHAFAAAMFDRTRELMGVSQWHCRLTPRSEEERQRQSVGRAAGVYGELSYSDPAGTFRVGEEVEITYAPRLLSDPPALVGTFAHELCHYLLATVKSEPPCGWKELEPLTDLAAVREGFGIFLCNAAFNFSQWTDHQYSGWKWSKQGYLTEAELGFALGNFCVRHDVVPDEAGKYLKLNPSEVFWDSIEYIRELEEREASKRTDAVRANKVGPRAHRRWWQFWK